MPERVIGLGEIVEHRADSPWVVVFGGVTREGNRRARRAAQAAVHAELDVIWFDGFSERSGLDPESERVAIESTVPVDSVLVIDYADEERRHWLNRMVDAVPSAIARPIEKAEELTADRESGRVAYLTRVRRVAQRTLGLFRMKVLRRLSLLFRGLIGWRIVRGDVLALAASLPPPREIIYGDDFSFTIGWHAARIWPEAGTSMEFVER